jgi:broad specificity phosphatase PhoE
MKRTLETSRLAGIEMPVVEPELREIDFGLWETMSFEQIRSSSPELVEEWAQYVPNFSFPGGEGIAEFVSRVQNVGDRLAACAGETVLAFTHGGVIRALICHFLGLSPRNYVLFDVKPCSMTTINLFDGKGVLAGLNDICHLEAN